MKKIIDYMDEDEFEDIKLNTYSFYKTELYKLEMSLFADAENLAISFLSAHE